MVCVLKHGKIANLRTSKLVLTPITYKRACLNVNLFPAALILLSRFCKNIVINFQTLI